MSSPRVLVVDNYDSFTFNLVQYLLELGADVVVRRNDAIDLDTAEGIAPDALLISPGPGRPETAGITLDAIARFAGRIPILGVCLGHQCIGAACGGLVVRGRAPVHGKTARIHHDGRSIFTGLPSPITGTRYHSLIIDPDRLPGALEISARTEDGVIMGVRHRFAIVEGVQFHPESVLTEYGHAMLRNFLAIARGQAPPGLAGTLPPTPAPAVRAPNGLERAAVAGRPAGGR